MEIKYKRLKAIALAGTLTVASSGLTGCGNDTVTITQDTTVHFDAGEHTISVPISKKNDIRETNVQYEYHSGYEPIGISITGYGKYRNQFGGGAIIYTNTEDVECSSNLVNSNGIYICTDFGTPTYYKDVKYNSNNSTKEFDIGEHIISTPISEDNRSEQIQYDYHAGYEIVGIATSASGDGFNKFGGGVLLYKNTTPVQCTLEDHGYTTFGTPVEMEKEGPVKTK